MSAKGLFIKGFTELEVKQIQANAKKLLMEGKTIMSWNDGSTSVSKQFTMPVTDILEECAYALTHFERQADDDDYGAATCREYSTIKKLIPKIHYTAIC